MKITDAVDALAALAQETRLAVFRLLIESGPQGVSAGQIATTLELPAATLSFHVAHLKRAGLIEARQEGRFIYYSAAFARMDDLIAFLTDKCCGGASCLPKTAAAATARKRFTKSC
jgi:DNA-binding transcriptional ArsR family regulator